MPQLSNYTRTRIINLFNQKYRPVQILQLLKNEGITVSLTTVTRLIKKYTKTNSTKDRNRSGRPSKVTKAIQDIIETQMRKDDETTSKDLRAIIRKNHGVKLGSSTIRKARREQGWTMAGSGYCQLIRNYNKPKRVDFVQQVLKENDDLGNVIYTDESTSRQRGIGISVLGNSENRKKRNPSQNIQLRFMCGLESRSTGQQTSVFSKELWTPRYIVKFSNKLCCHL